MIPVAILRINSISLVVSSLQKHMCNVSDLVGVLMYCGTGLARFTASEFKDVTPSSLQLLGWSCVSRLLKIKSFLPWADLGEFDSYFNSGCPLKICKIVG
jgi:hypothetical protein